MRVERVELRKILLPYPSVFETSGWRETGSHAIIVRVDGEGVTGWGESPVGQSPFYNEENTSTAWAILREYLVAMLLDTELDSPEDVTPAFSRVRLQQASRWRMTSTRTTIPRWY